MMSFSPALSRLQSGKWYLNFSTGGLSIAVPGEVRGQYDAWKRHGRSQWKQLVQPAIDLARNGFKITKSVDEALQAKDIEKDILGDPGLRSVHISLVYQQHRLTQAPFTRVRTNFCTGENLHSSTLRLHETGGTGRIFQQLRVQVLDLKKAGQLFDRHGSIFVRTRVNTRTLQLFSQIARLWPGIKCRNWSNLCTDPCKHHCNRTCTNPCKQAVQERNSSV